MKTYSTHWYDDRHGLSATVKPHEKLTRDYDFTQGDVRRFDRGEAVRLAKQRAGETGFVQQVSHVDGTPLGKKIYLIQTTTKPIKKPEPVSYFKIGDRVDHVNDAFGDFKNGVVVGYSLSARGFPRIQVRWPYGTAEHPLETLRQAKLEPVRVPYAGTLDLGDLRRLVEAAKGHPDDAEIKIIQEPYEVDSWGGSRIRVTQSTYLGVG